MGSIGDVTARMTLDGSQFEAGTKKAEQVMTASSRGIQMSAEKAAVAQALAAKLAGDAVSTQSLRIIAARVNEKVATVELTRAMKLMSDGYGGEAAGANLAAAALQRLTAAKAETAAASTMEAIATHNAGHAAVSEMNATSAAVRSLEGNPGIRAVERFLTTIPGVGLALQAAFPLIGGIAFGAMVGELIKKVYDFEQAGKLAGKEIADGWDQINRATRKAGAEIDVTNDKLQIQIAKLEHKPENLLRLALDESRVSAFNLTEQIEKANAASEKLMKEKGVGELKAFGLALLGQNIASTTPDETLINASKARVTRTQYDATDRLDRAQPGEDKDRVQAQNRATLLAVFDEEIKKERAALQSVYGEQRVGKGIDFSARTAMNEGRLQDLQNQRSVIAGGSTTEDKAGQLKKDEDKKRLREDATKASEAMRKAAELQMKSFEAGEVEMQAAYGKNLTMDATYWNGKLLTLTTGSANYTAVLKKTSEASEKEQERLTAAKKKYAEYAMVSLPGDAGMAMIQRWAETLPKEDVDRIGPRWEAYNREAAKAKEITAATTASMQLAAIQVQVATGALDRHAAAMKLAEIHAEGYKAKLGILAAELARINADPELQLKGGVGLNPQGSAESQAIQNQMASTQGAADAQGVKDKQDVASTTMLGGAKDALQEFIAASLDGAKAMKELTSYTLNELNKDILTQITTRHPQHAFRNLGSDVARNVAGSALKAGEGQLMKALFGINKKVQHVHVDNFPGSGAASGIGGIVGSAASGAGGFIGKALGFAAKLLPGLAEGGVMTANSMAWVGERGPELFRPGVAGSVIPNHAATGSGGVTQHFHVDARGSTDPAQTAAMVHRAMRQYAPSLVAASVKAGRDGLKRLPSSHR